MNKPTTAEIIEWCKKESCRNAEMQGDKNHSARRRKTFRYRNHMLVACIDRLEALEANSNANWTLAVKQKEHTEKAERIIKDMFSAK